MATKRASINQIRGFWSWDPEVEFKTLREFTFPRTMKGMRSFRAGKLRAKSRVEADNEMRAWVSTPEYQVHEWITPVILERGEDRGDTAVPAADFRTADTYDFVEPEAAAAATPAPKVVATGWPKKKRARKPDKRIRGPRRDRTRKPDLRSRPGRNRKRTSPATASECAGKCIVSV